MAKKRYGVPSGSKRCWIYRGHLYTKIGSYSTGATYVLKSGKRRVNFNTTSHTKFQWKRVKK